MSNARRILAFALLSILAATVLPQQITFAARKGNIANEVNYNAVLDGRINVCNESTLLAPSILSYAVEQWNEAHRRGHSCGGMWRHSRRDRLGSSLRRLRV